MARQTLLIQWKCFDGFCGRVPTAAGWALLAREWFTHVEVPMPLIELGADALRTLQDAGEQLTPQVVESFFMSEAAIAD